MVTALDMAPMLKAGRRKKGEKGETALTLPSPFYQQVEVFPEPLKRLPCRSNWPMYKENSLLFLLYCHTTALHCCLSNAQGLSLHLRQFPKTS